MSDDNLNNSLSQDSDIKEAPLIGSGRLIQSIRILVALVIVVILLTTTILLYLKTSSNNVGVSADVPVSG